MKQVEKSVMRYFELVDDMRIMDRWELDSPLDKEGQEIWHGQFSRGTPLEVRTPASVPLYSPGRALDYTTTALGIPVVHARVKEVFERLQIQEQVQFFPTAIAGQSDSYFLVNVLQVVRCIDDARCEAVFYYTEEDEEPERVGEYRNVRGLRIDPSQVGDRHIFRPWGWQLAIIVSERVKESLDVAGITGARFRDV
jgi:hypothetical protein